MDLHYFAKLVVLVALFVVLGMAETASESIVDQMNDLLSNGVKSSIFPAVVGIGMKADGSFQYANSFGHLDYSTDSLPSTFDTKFDLASLSKVVATTTAVAVLYQRGYVSLDDRIANYLGSKFGVNGKENITILNCLLHNAGFPPDPIPWYWSLEFGCPNTSPDLNVIPNEDFSCLPKQYDSLLSQYLDNSVGAVYVYSDLSFITLQMVIGNVAYANKLISAKQLRSECTNTNESNLGELFTCYFEAFVRTEVFQFSSSHKFRGKHEIKDTSMLMPKTGYSIPAEEYSHSVYTINDTGEGSYSHQRFQGQVSDGDCYSMGGICGHAGVFSTATDLSRFLSAFVAAIDGSSDPSVFMLNSTTIALFTTMYNVSQSSRALGWTTNTPEVKDYGFDQSCGTLSSLTFMHTGYTGGCICVDPVNKIYSIVLSNRVYNCQGQLCPAGSSDAVKAVFKQFNTLLASAAIPQH